MAEPVVLRAHHLLCAGEFRGLGYTPVFVANFARVLAGLAGRPAARVRLTDGTDVICAACPWLVEGSCVRDGGGEAAVSRLDGLVLARLGLEPGATLTWARLRGLADERADRAWRMKVCRECSWFGAPCYQAL
ncbi:MAG: DUF1284 domain-containing protein, partial [Bacillota bacterium]